jgi:3-dehydroquinate synthetase
MVDSAVGGKTAINRRQGKNLVGSFHQPILVYSAIDTLSTLPDRELGCGLGEVLKHGILADPRLFEHCAEDAEAIWAREPQVLADLVERSCRVKADVVKIDEREQGHRAVLNLGHTVGHALEAALLGTDGALPHGQCVALGLVAEARWSADRGHCPTQLAERIESVAEGLGLPVAPGPLDWTAVYAAAQVDKKVRHGRLRMPIVEGIGQVRLLQIDASEIETLFHSFPGSC